MGVSAIFSCMNPDFLCPCGTQKLYGVCCKPYHLGALPENALLLMRSRYTAYALKLADYIIQTTHPRNPSYNLNFQEWRQAILHFCENTRFEGLKIVEFVDGEKVATVTFTAHLKQGGQNASFTEKSTFEKVDKRWLYKDGVVKTE